jgi:hypothetical protein
MTAPRPGDAATARLLALYEMVAEAPDAVPRLRRFVLDLAVRGSWCRRHRETNRHRNC